MAAVGCHPRDGQRAGGGSPSTVPEKQFSHLWWCRLVFLYGEQRPICCVHKLMSKLENEASSFPTEQSCWTSSASHKSVTVYSFPAVWLGCRLRMSCLSGRGEWDPRMSQARYFQKRQGDVPSKLLGLGQVLEEFSLEQGQGCRSNWKNGRAHLRRKNWPNWASVAK